MMDIFILSDFIMLVKLWRSLLEKQKEIKIRDTFL